MPRVRVRALAVALALTQPLAARAIDAPHVAGDACKSCHLGHNAPGGSLTKTSGNFNLCESCHQSQPEFGFPSWSPAMQATVGGVGTSHRWDAPASNLGATPPSASSSDPDEAAMGQLLDQGKLQCSTCHDQHDNGDGATGLPLPPSGRGTQHRSLVTRRTALASTGSIAVASAPPDLAAKSYLLEITAQGAVGTARFRWSSDGGATWMQEDLLTAASAPLSDAVVLRFTNGGAGTSFVAGERFTFYVSYPYLRVDLTRMCVTCHRDRHMHWQDVEGRSDGRLGAGLVLGTTVFSHPVGQPLDANGRGYDRTGGILEPGGGVQGGAGDDGNPSNDVVTSTGDATGLVGCTSCHHPHNADSNSLTSDPR